MSRKRNRGGSQPKVGGLGFHEPNYFQSASWNRRTFMMYRQWIVSLALTRFKWVGLPDTCDPRYLEWTLLNQGVATIAFPKSEPDTWYSTQVITDGQINLYDNPVSWRSFGNNGHRFDVDPTNGILVYDNYQRLPIMDVIDIFARRLAALDRTMDQNLANQHHPVLLAVPQEMRNDAIQLFKQMQGGEPGVIGTSQLRELAECFETIDLGVEYIGAELNEAKSQLWSEVYAFLGIDNLPRKADRMIESEVLATNEPAELRALDPLVCRREACEKLGKRFGLNIGVYWRQDYESQNFNFAHDKKQQFETKSQSEMAPWGHERLKEVE